MAKSIAIITSQFSVVVKSIENGLLQEGYDVTLIGDNIDTITDLMKTTDVFLLYLPDRLVDDTKKIYNILLLSDKFKDSRRRIILIGNDRDYDDFMKAVPGLKEFPWINRPVNMLQLQSEIEHEEKRQTEKNAKKKILVIDDDFVYAQTLVDWMKSSYSIEAVTDGMSGITYLTNTKVDLVILDFEMPVVDGPKIFEMMKMHPSTASTPVIFISESGSKDSLMRAMRLKPQNFLVKSMASQEIVGAVKEYFEARANSY